jgi:hypothetical protein
MCNWGVRVDEVFSGGDKRRGGGECYIADLLIDWEVHEITILRHGSATNLRCFGASLIEE